MIVLFAIFASHQFSEKFYLKNIVSLMFRKYDITNSKFIPGLKIFAFLSSDSVQIHAIIMMSHVEKYLTRFWNIEK